MPDSESSDVLANLPTGRPARRSSRRATPGASATPPAAGAGAAAPAAKTPAKRTTAAKPKATAAAKSTTTAAKPKTTAKPKATAAAKPAAAKRTPAKPAAARTTAAKSTAAAKTTAAAKAKPAAKKPAAAKPRATAKASAAKDAPATTPRATPARRPRIATPPDGRRADVSGSPATHRARKVTTNRPWLPSSGYALPETKDRPPLGVALEGLAGALGDVARVSIGIVQSLSARRRGEIEAPESESETPRATKS